MTAIDTFKNCIVFL